MSDKKTTEKETKKDDGMAAKLRGLEDKVNKVINRLEQVFGFDLDGDGQVGKGGNTKVAMLIVMVLCVCAFGANEVIHQFMNSTGDTSVWKVDAEGDVTATSFTGIGSGLTGFNVTLGDNVASLEFTNGTDTGTCYLDFIADRGDDAGDYTRLLFPATGGMLFQSDITTEDTLATKITVTSAGAVTLNSTLAVTGVATLTAIPVLNGGLDVNEDVDIDFDATDEEFAIESSAPGSIVSRVYANSANPSTTTLLSLDFSANSDADGTYLTCRDNSAGDTVFSVGEDGNTVVAGTLAVTGASTLTGVATFTAESIHDLGIDADYITVDAAAGIDTKSAGALLVGAATATSIEIGDTAVTTDIQGPLTVLGSTGAGIDAAGATALFIGEATATSVSIGASDIDTTILGPLNVLEATGKGIDTTGAGALYLGEAVATSVVLGASDANTTVAGDLVVTGLDIDSAAGAMTIGKAIATSLVLGAADIDTTIAGPLNVLQATGKGIDTTGAGALHLGEAVATSVVLGASDAGTTIEGQLTVAAVDVGDTTNYTVLAANSGHTHIIPAITADSVYTMPAEAAGLYYKFVNATGAAEAQDWSFNTGADANYFVGGIVKHDPDSGGDDTATTYSDGDSNSQLAILTPEAGTVIEMWCIDGTTWYVSGTVISATDASVVFADQ